VDFFSVFARHIKKIIVYAVYLLVYNRIERRYITRG